MKIKDLREMTSEELVSRRRELKQDALSSRIQQASGQLENPARLKALRREVARMESIISERRLNLTPQKSAAAKPAKAAAAPKAKAVKAPRKKTTKAAE